MEYSRDRFYISYRDFAKGFVNWDQVRAEAWSFRTLLQLSMRNQQYAERGANFQTFRLSWWSYNLVPDTYGACDVVDDPAAAHDRAYVFR